MRSTVDEKLQGTLEKRLGESFKLVSERLEQVHQGLGAMRQLASDVGGLQKVLANVKTRGGCNNSLLRATNLRGSSFLEFPPACQGGRLMISRRVFIASSAAVALTAGFPAWAAEMAFVQARFDEALKAGKPILVEIHASWCPTCKAQTAILGPMFEDPNFADLTVLRVDFDAQKDVVRKFGAIMQSTLIVFKGGAEVARSVGDTNPASIAALLGKAI